jgi:hypothetical protein
MSVLVVDYSAISHLNSTATSLARKFQKRVDDYEGIAKGINSLPTSRSNLENANYFIKKKNEQYQSKINKLDAFKTKMNNFSEKAEATDKRVASRITSETNAFKKANKINISIFAVLGGTLTSPWTKMPLVRRIDSWIEEKTIEAKHSIKDWYANGGKYIIEIVKTVAIAAVVAAITILTLGTGTLFFVALSLSLLAINTGSEVYYKTKAYQNGSNRIEAERLSKKSGFDMVASVGGVLDRKTGFNCIEKGLTGLFLVATVVDFGYTSYKLATAFKTEFKNVKLAKNYARKNGNWAGAKHFFKKSYTFVNEKFTRKNTTKILKPLQKILKNKTQNYFPVRKAINTVLKPYKYYNQVINNYTIIPKYEKGKKIAHRLQDALMGGSNKTSLAN